MVPEEDFLGVKQFLLDIRSYTDEEVAQFDTVTVKDVLHKYTKNPLACSCIWMVCAVYTCLPYWEASAGEFMRCLRWEIRRKSFRAIPKAAARLSPIHTARHSQSSAVR